MESEEKHAKQRQEHTQNYKQMKEHGILRELRKVIYSLKNDVGYEPGQICEGQIVESYMGCVDEIELADTSELMAIFESLLLKMNMIFLGGKTVVAKRLLFCGPGKI